MDEAVRRVTGDQLAQLMFPRFGDGGDAKQLTQGMNASPGRRRRQGRVLLRGRRGVGRPGGEGRAGPPGDQPRRPLRDDRRRGRAHQPRRQDLARRRRRPGHGQDVRLRRRGAEGRHQEEAVHRPRRHGGQRGRRHLDRRVDRAGVAGRGAGGGAGRRPLLRGRDRAGRPTTPTTWCAACTGSSPTPTRSGGWRCGPTPTPRRTPPAPAASARRASGCAAPSTCSWATGGSWWRR